jgi:hypothetical protein
VPPHALEFVRRWLTYRDPANRAAFNGREISIDLEEDKRCRTKFAAGEATPELFQRLLESIVNTEVKDLGERRLMIEHAPTKGFANSKLFLIRAL